MFPLRLLKAIALMTAIPLLVLTAPLFAVPLAVAARTATTCLATAMARFLLLTLPRLVIPAGLLGPDKLHNLLNAISLPFVSLSAPNAKVTLILTSELPVAKAQLSLIGPLLTKSRVPLDPITR